MLGAPLRLAVDARAAAEVPAGRGRYVRELTAAMIALDEATITLYGRKPWPLAGSSWRRLMTPGPLWAVHAGLAAASGHDAILATNSYLMAVAPAPTVVVVQDLFGFDRRYDLPVSALAERLTLPLAVRRAAGFICPSRATADELNERFPATAARTRVIPLGVDRAFLVARPAGVAAKHGIGGPYILAVGTLEPRKNLVRLVRAFAALPDAVRGDVRLVLAGGRGWSIDELDALTAGRPDLVATPGFVPDDELPALYAGALAFACPSLAEGFGLPVLEAMAAGSPVLTSNRSSLAEVAGDAAVTVDPEDDRAIGQALARLIGDSGQREELIARGRERAAGYTWQRTAHETLAYLRSVSSTFAAGKARASPVSS